MLLDMAILVGVWHCAKYNNVKSQWWCQHIGVRWWCLPTTRHLVYPAAHPPALRVAREQAVLELPTVTRSGLGVRRWAGRRGQQPWSEFVDGEAFLEALLLVVLCARVSISIVHHVFTVWSKQITI